MIFSSNRESNIYFNTHMPFLTKRKLIRAAKKQIINPICKKKTVRILKEWNRVGKLSINDILGSESNIYIRAMIASGMFVFVNGYIIEKKQYEDLKECDKEKNIKFHSLNGLSLLDNQYYTADFGRLPISNNTYTFLKDIHYNCFLESRKTESNHIENDDSDSVEVHKKTPETPDNCNSFRRIIYGLNEDESNEAIKDDIEKGKDNPIIFVPGYDYYISEDEYNDESDYEDLNKEGKNNNYTIRTRSGTKNSSISPSDRNRYKKVDSNSFKWFDESNQKRNIENRELDDNINIAQILYNKYLHDLEKDQDDFDNYTFSEMAIHICMRNGVNDGGEFERRTYLTRNIYSQMKNHSDYCPNFSTAITIALVFCKNFDEVNALLARNGMTLIEKGGNKYNLMLLAIAHAGINDIDEINELLEENGFDCLGSKLRW